MPLKFYPDFVGPRTFFFNSLYEKDSIEAQNLLNLGHQYIDIDNQLDFDENDFLQETYKAIEFLRQSAEQALKNEQRIFEQKIWPICKNTKYESQCKACFQGDTVDYDQFLALINELTHNTEEAKSLLKDLYESMNNYNEIAQEFIKDKTYTEIKQNYGDITTQIKIKSIEDKKKIVSDRAEIFAKQLKIYNDVTENKTNDNVNYLKNFLSLHFSDLFKKGTKEYHNPRQKDIYMTELISSALEFIAAHKDLMSETNKNTYQIDQLITPFLQQIEENEQLKIQFLDFIENQTKLLDKQGELLQQKNQQLIALINQISKKKIQVNQDNIYKSGLTINIRRLLANKFPELAGQNNKFITGFVNEYDESGHLLEQKKLQFNMNKKTDRDEYFKELRKVFVNQTDEEIIKEINNIIKNQEKRTDTITIASEYDSAKLINYIFSGSMNLTGRQNLRNDATAYTIGNISLKTDMSDKKQLQFLQKAIHQAANQDKQYGTTYELKIKQQTGKKGKNYDLEAAIETQNISERRFLKTVEENLPDIINFNPSDIFQIDNSVKFHETYNEKTGFTGGSLGSNIDKQVENITKMLDLGGISLIDADFLIAAVMNAGDAMIGAGQRSALENYFSSVASMLMFRSGGQELNNIGQQGSAIVSNDMTKIHLYTFNTLFFPESYILQKTYEGLIQCTDLLHESASNYGSRASIYNAVTEKDIVYDKVKSQTTINGQHYGAIKIPDWEKTASSPDNLRKVSIDMVLMGGFLDVMRKILEIMNNY